MLITAAGITFIEQTRLGGVFITTVYDTRPSSTAGYVVVDTRHNTLFGEPSISQYFGTCKAAF
jgi:hypothetical protein